MTFRLRKSCRLFTLLKISLFYFTWVSLHLSQTRARNKWPKSWPARNKRPRLWPAASVTGAVILSLRRCTLSSWNQRRKPCNIFTSNWNPPVFIHHKSDTTQALHIHFIRHHYCETIAWFVPSNAARSTKMIIQLGTTWGDLQTLAAWCRLASRDPIRYRCSRIFIPCFKLFLGDIYSLFYPLYVRAQKTSLPFYFFINGWRRDPN